MPRCPSHRISRVPLGLYISVPFCRTKCSYCNFASDVFSKSAYENYVSRLLEDVGNARQFASQFGCPLDELNVADSIYLGGGTPSILDDRTVTPHLRRHPRPICDHARCRNHRRMRSRHTHSLSNRNLAALRSEPGKPGSAVLRRPGSAVRRAPAQTRNRPRRDRPSARGRPRQHQHRPDRRLAAPDAGKLDLLVIAKQLPPAFRTPASTCSKSTTIPASAAN